MRFGDFFCTYIRCHQPILNQFIKSTIGFLHRHNTETMDNYRNPALNGFKNLLYI